MNWTFWLILMILSMKCVSCNEEKKENHEVENNSIESRAEDFNKISGDSKSWREAFTMYPTVATWTVQTGIPVPEEESVTDMEDPSEYARGRKKGGMKKKMKKYMMPLLIAYKLKFFTLIPVIIGGLILLTGATGLAGFFFALFAAVMGLKTGGQSDSH